jgi:signal peptidase
MTQTMGWDVPRHLSPTSSVRALAFVVIRAAQMLVAFVMLGVLAAFALGGLVLHLGISPVLSGSMRPAYDPGDALITRPVDVHKLRVGDIAIIMPPGEKVVYAHRVTSISDKNNSVFVTTKGDANPAPDRWRTELHGTTVDTVVGTIPHFGRVMTWTDDPWVRGLVIAIVGISLTAIGTKSILRTDSGPWRAPTPASRTSPPTRLHKERKQHYEPSHRA